MKRKPMNRTLLAVMLAASAGLGAGCAFGDDDDRGYGERRWNWFGMARGSDIRPVDNPLYRDECGACHFAYQPGLLPARSWEAIMTNLDDHFGENAELDAATQDELTRYLVQYAADRDDYGRSRGFAASVARGDAPLRVTETRYFRGKHDEVPLRLVEGNPDVGSFSNCAACHQGAAEGSYDEHQVRIPGVGRWDD